MPHLFFGELLEFGSPIHLVPGGLGSRPFGRGFSFETLRIGFLRVLVELHLLRPVDFHRAPDDTAARWYPSIRVNGLLFEEQKQSTFR